MKQANAAINMVSTTLPVVPGVKTKSKTRGSSKIWRKILEKINYYLENISPIAYTHFGYWK